MIAQQKKKLINLFNFFKESFLMVTIQRYFLYILMFNSFYLSAMERVVETLEITESDHQSIVFETTHAKIIVFDTHIKNIAAKIDRDHLKIGACECWHLKNLLGSCVSFVKGRFLMTYQQSEAEMNKIVSYIPEDVNKKNFVKELVATHWYVYYLMHNLVLQKIEELEAVTGSTIDALYNDYRNEKDVIKRIVCDDAYKIFSNKLRRFTDTHNLNSIDCIVLYGPHGDLQPSSLAISSDGKYVGAIDHNNTHLRWDMQTGKRIDPEDAEKKIEWIGANLQPKTIHLDYDGYYDVTDKNERFYAVTTYEGMSDRRKGIVLCKSPQIASDLYQRALENSKTFGELYALESAKTIKSIEGFPQGNLNRGIENKRTSLIEKSCDGLCSSKKDL
jgi:hypothetical protein